MRDLSAIFITSLSVRREPMLHFIIHFGIKTIASGANAEDDTKGWKSRAVSMSWQWQGKDGLPVQSQGYSLPMPPFPVSSRFLSLYHVVTEVLFHIRPLKSFWKAKGFAGPGAAVSIETLC